MIKANHSMLSSILEMFRANEGLLPMGNHPMFQKVYEGEIQTLVNEVTAMSEFTDTEKNQLHLWPGLITDALSLFTERAENPSWIQMSLEQRLAKVKAIQESPQIPQRSEEWYKNYSKVLTASEFSALFSQTKRRRDLVYSKVAPPAEQNYTFRTACPTNEMNALGWGIRFEPVVKQLIEYRDKCLLFEPGRLQHPTNIHLAASPDAVIQSSVQKEQVGRLVEIKCPYSRTIGGEIPSDYWIQMQIQMEVTDVDECEYIEATLISQRPHQQEPVDLSGTTYQGVLYLLQTIDEPMDYKYLYGEIGSTEMPALPSGFVCVESIPWGLKTWHRKLVHRDRAWYEATKPWQEAFWNDVDVVRNGGELSVSTPKQKPQPTCLITDD